MLILRGVQISHRFGTRVVLQDVDIEVRADGTTVSIAAPSGSGKSTLLAILGGLLVPTQGSVHIEDEEGGNKSRQDSSVSWVLQTPSALGRRSVLDNVALGALASGGSLNSAHLTAGHLLSVVGLEHVANDPSRKLSGGELQRLSIARAMATGRRFILADEPTGQLDASTSSRVADALFDTVAAGALGLILVTHDLGLAGRCDRQLTLVDGRLVDRS